MAAPPQNGIYQSTDLGGTMLTGRYSESWSMPGGWLQQGNTTNKMSWDGATLGTQWWMYCAEIALPANLIDDTVDGNGNGQRTYNTIYSGGLCVLDGNGPWGDGSEPSYTALYTSYSETNTFSFNNNQVVGVVTSVNLQAAFIGFQDACMSLSISNQEELGNTDIGPLAENYPGFLDPAGCAPTRTTGSWGDSFQFTLIIFGCTVPTEESSWGAIKALYE